MLEAHVHSSLLNFLRDQHEESWPHHLTLARLVARALRLQRSALLQTAASPSTYSLSYLMALLLWSDGVIVVAPTAQQQTLRDCLNALQKHLQHNRELCRVGVGDRVSPDFNGLALTSPQVWLADRLSAQTQFPLGMPTVIDGVDDLDTWARSALTLTLTPQDWSDLAQKYPDRATEISKTQQQIIQWLADCPPNPYGHYLLQATERDAIAHLREQLQAQILPPQWNAFIQQLSQPQQLCWASRRDEHLPKQATLHLTPEAIAPHFEPIWQQQPTVLMGRYLGIERQSGQFWRDRLGLGDLTTVKFAPQRQQELIQLYVPERLPLPNTSAFQGKLLTQILRLCRGGMLGQRHGRHRPPEWIAPLKRPVVIIVEDTPLRTQVGTALAAEFGSCVQLETPILNADSLLVTGWDFWQQHQEQLPPPQLLVIATLPIPSMENPFVAQRVQTLKHQRQDWFQHYLLPTAIQRLQRAVLPVRDRQGVVALLDNRVNHRSYGAAVFQALEPYARINYIDFIND